MLALLLKCVLALVIIIVLLGFLRTWQEEHSADQTSFSAGTTPQPAPDGFYSGSVAGLHTSWLGKTFDAQKQSGINVFNTGSSTQAQKYSFTTSFGKGLSDDLTVLKIDYNAAGNPWWVRPILDELVQTAPGQYLGKMQLRIIPGYPFTVLFFQLSHSA